MCGKRLVCVLDCVQAVAGLQAGLRGHVVRAHMLDDWRLQLRAAPSAVRPLFIACTRPTLPQKHAVVAVAPAGGTEPTAAKAASEPDDDIDEEINAGSDGDF